MDSTFFGSTEGSVFGSTLNPSHSLYRNGMNPSNMDEALNLIPISDKLALLQAFAVCPDIVQLESPSLRFIEFEEYNYFNAARRLAKYWDVRLSLFGPERAFRSVFDLTGNGALRPELLDYIATGTAVVLPPDDHQRPVLFSDRSRLPAEFVHWPNESRLMLTFAIFQKIMLLSYDFVIVFLAANKPRFFPSIGSFVSDLISYAFPLKPPTVYVVCRTPRSNFKSFVATYIPVILRIVNRNVRNFKITIEIGEKEELLKKLVQNGLHPERLPESVGGTWTYEGFEDWFRNQRLRYAASYGTRVEDSVLSKTKCLALEVELGNNQSPHMGIEKLIQNQGIIALAEKVPTLSTGIDAASPFSTCDIPLDIKEVILQVANIAFHEKLNYCEALKMAPHLESTEAKLDTFLLLEDGNPKATAQRVVSYWNLRKALFKERFRLPLLQLEGCALNSDDLRTLKCGYITLLPKNQNGRSVLCCDASRLEKDDPESRLRCLLYMLHVAVESASLGKDGSTKEGVSLFLVMNKLSFERTCKDRGLAHLLSVVPAKISAIHIIRQPARLGVALFREKVVPAIQAMLQPLKNIPIHANCGSQSRDLREDLSAHGFESRNLPRSLGGGWTYQEFLEWREQRLITEQLSQLQMNQPFKGNPTEPPRGVGVDTMTTPNALLPLLATPLTATSILPIPAPPPMDLQMNLLALEKQMQMRQTPQTLPTLFDASLTKQNSIQYF